MDIPQEELDKLNSTEDKGEDFFPDAEEEEAPEVKEDVEEEQETVSSSADEDVVADKARVPYSRFETMHERAIRAEERAKLLEEQQATKTTDQEVTDPLLNKFINLYGDNDEAREAYSIQVEMNNEMVRQSFNKIKEEQAKAEQEQKNSLNQLEQGLDDLSQSLGRKLSETEQSSILDIQDEFAVKDEQGNYLAPLISTDKAYEIYTLRTSKDKSSKSVARRKVVSLTGSSSDSSSDSNPWANYDPRQQGQWMTQL